MFRSLPQSALVLLLLSSLAELPLVPPPNREDELLVDEVVPSLAHPEEAAPPARPLPFSASASHSVSPVEVEEAVEDVVVEVDVNEEMVVEVARGARVMALSAVRTGAARELMHNAAMIERRS